MKKSKHTNGLTLLELLWVVVIMAILAILVIPAYLTRFDEAHHLSSSDKIAHRMMQMLREEQKINYPAMDLPRSSGPNEIEPSESEEDVQRSIILNPKWEPEQLPKSRLLDLHLWMLDPNNVPIKLP